MSLDGYVAGADQSIDDPLGKGGEALHEWIFATRSWRRAARSRRGRGDLRRRYVAAGSSENVGATIMGRNMFGPVRGPWPDEAWRGWWGEDPPFHTPVFVLTHHERAPLEMEGGTTFHFVTDGIESALEQAVAAAEGKDVTLGGGASTAQQYLRAGLRRRAHRPCRAGPARRRGAAVRPPRRVPVGLEPLELEASPAVAHFRYARAG